MKIFMQSMLFFMLLTTSSAFGQQILFRVIAIKGDVQFAIKDSEKWNRVVFGEKLKSDDILKLGRNVYLGMVHSSGRTIELKKEGIYKVSDLIQTVKPLISESISFKFVGYLINEMNNNRTKKNMDVLGAVYRDNQPEIKVFMPRKTNIMDSVICFSWYKSPDVIKYYFKISDKFSRVVLEMETADTLIDINKTKFSLENDCIYYWKVTANKSGSEAPDSWFYILSEQNCTSIKDSVNNILKDNNYEENPAVKYLLAEFYIKNKIYYMAISLLKEINLLEPDVEQYSEAYQNLIKTLELK